jgi:hypothetical protein
VLGSLGTSIDKYTNRLEEYQEQASPSKPIEYFPKIEISFPKDAEQEEPHPKVNRPIE